MLLNQEQRQNKIKFINYFRHCFVSGLEAAAAGTRRSKLKTPPPSMIYFLAAAAVEAERQSLTTTGRRRRGAAWADGVSGGERARRRAGAEGVAPSPSASRTYSRPAGFARLKRIQVDMGNKYVYITYEVYACICILGNPKRLNWKEISMFAPDVIFGPI